MSSYQQRYLAELDQKAICKKLIVRSDQRK